MRTMKRGEGQLGEDSDNEGNPGIQVKGKSLPLKQKEASQDIAHHVLPERKEDTDERAHVYQDSATQKDYNLALLVAKPQC